MDLKLTKYEPESFAALNEFEPARNLLEKHREGIDGLGDVIRSFHFEHSLGICLLHKHFDVSEDEILVETISTQSAKISPQPVSKALDVVPYMWRLFGITDGALRWTPLEFVKKDCVEESLVEFLSTLQTAHEFFDKFSQKLLELGVVNVFGLALHHRSRICFDRAEQVLLENESFEERHMRIRPVPRERTTQSDWTQTLWNFPSEGGFFADAECEGHGCSVHCANHIP